jgi:putative resolvase
MLAGVKLSEVGQDQRVNGHRTRLLSLLRGALAGTIVAGHRERLACLGVEYLDAAFAARGGKLIVAGQAGVGDDLVRDMVEVVTSFGARLYGRRPARRLAGFALAAASGDQAA